MPERSLQREQESAEGYRERVGAMRRAGLTFGAGSRTCPGMDIILLKIYQVVPMLFLEYDVGLAEWGGEWRSVNRWLMRQEDRSTGRGGSGLAVDSFRLSRPQAISLCEKPSVAAACTWSISSTATPFLSM